jgi:hypothetical protein
MRPLLCSLISTLIALSACLDTSPAPTSSASQAVQSCSSSCDCPYGAYCANHACVGDFGPFAPCYCAARDCPSGQVCNTNGAGGGSCEATCNDICDCAYGAFCQSGHCVGDFGPFAPCYCGPRDCPSPGDFCSNGFCSDGGGGGG